MVYLCDGRPLRQRRLKPRETATDGQSRRLGFYFAVLDTLGTCGARGSAYYEGALPSTVNEGWDSDFRVIPYDFLTGKLYSKEDCGHNDPSMSPDRRSKGVFTHYPSPQRGQGVLYCP